MNTHQTAKANNLHKLSALMGELVPRFIVLSSKSSESVIVDRVSTAFPNSQLILRTSAEGEDTDNYSFAGLFESIAGIDSEDHAQLIDSFHRCANSLKAKRVRAYTQSRNLPLPTKAEIIIQEYKTPQFSGAAFIYPDSPHQSLISIGTSNNITEGGEALATLHLDTLLTSEISQAHAETWKKLQLALLELASKMTHPLDVEWVISNNQVYLVQMRPISADLTPSSFGEIIFDSTNIGENYPGITAPLTYTFVRSAYNNVYLSFLRILHTSSPVIVSNTYAISNLVAYVDGRIYYNLTNWYRLLKLLPFFSVNKKFFDRMLSPVKSLNSIDSEPSQVSFKSSLLFIFYILFPYFRTKVFEAGFKQLFSNFSTTTWKNYSTVNVINRFESLRDSFFSLWGNTIINDFHVMVFWGLLVSLANRAFHKPEAYLNSVVNQNIFPESIAPLKALYSLAMHISASSSAQKLFAKKPEAILQSLHDDQQYAEIKNAFDNYLVQYGNRSGQELKIEVPKFSEDPQQVIILLKAYLGMKNQPNFNAKTASVFPKIRRAWLIPLVSLISHIAVKGVYRREKYRLMRGKAFSIARAVFLELGSRLKTRGLLTVSEDVFYLEYNELTSLCLHHSLPIAPQILVNERKKILNTFSKQKPATRMVAYDWNVADAVLVEDDAEPKKVLTGTGTSVTQPITGKVVVMEEFSVTTPVHDAILVTRKTDPGWTVLFPMLKGVVTETGSTLSHASIIARELSIPCITGVKNCTTLLKTGDTVTLVPEKGAVLRKTT